MSNKVWEQWEIDLTLSLFLEGKSAGHIAKQLGTRTRNAVIGHCHRELSGLIDRKAKVKLKRERKTIKTAKPPKRGRTTKPSARTSVAWVGPVPEVPIEPWQPLDQVWEPFPACEPVPLLALLGHHCRWPVTGGHCGRERVRGSYCQAHSDVAYRAGTSYKG